MGAAWELHGSCMGAALVLHGSCMGAAWELHGSCMGACMHWMVWGCNLRVQNVYEIDHRALRPGASHMKLFSSSLTLRGRVTRLGDFFLIGLILEALKVAQNSNI
jgi:hypothetical protein